MQYILVDSASDIQTDNKENYMHVPITITLAGRDYKDGENIDKETFYRLLRKSENFPKTSQPSPDVFFEIFQRVKKEKSSLVYLALSSMLSGTYQSALMTKTLAADRPAAVTAFLAVARFSAVIMADSVSSL